MYPLIFIIMGPKRMDLDLDPRSELSLDLLTNYILQFQPFNAFLSGFSAAVGQFVLTASLRMQTSDSGSGSGGKSILKGKSAQPEESEQGTGISHERFVL